MRLNPFKKKNRDEQEDLSMVSEYKEPFTWAGFWENQVVNRAKSIQAYLKERGILAFLMSPFQYRSRLVVIIMVIIMGIFVGIIPRSMSLVHTLRESYTKSEISQMSSQGITSGPMTVVPLISGQVNNDHVIVFNLNGTTAAGVPSVNSGFKVQMTSMIGLNPEKIQYSYKVLPMDDSNRLLVLYINDQKQQQHKAKVGLNIQIKGMPGMNYPATVIMSNQQQKSAVFDGHNINLASLSSALTNQESSSQGSSIKSAQQTLKSQLQTYELNYQRLYAMKVYVKMTPSQLNKLVQKQISMPSLTDNSTTQLLSGLDPNHPSASASPKVLTTEVLYNNKIYKTSSSNSASTTDDSDDSDSSNQIGDGNDTAQTEVTNLNNIFATISQDVANLNQSRLSKYQSLTGVQQTLNQKLTIDDFKQNMQHVTQGSNSSSNSDN